MNDLPFAPPAAPPTNRDAIDRAVVDDQDPRELTRLQRALWTPLGLVVAVVGISLMVTALAGIDDRRAGLASGALLVLLGLASAFVAQRRAERLGRAS